MGEDGLGQATVDSLTHGSLGDLRGPAYSTDGSHGGRRLGEATRRRPADATPSPPSWHQPLSQRPKERFSSPALSRLVGANSAHRRRRRGLLFWPNTQHALALRGMWNMLGLCPARTSQGVSSLRPALQRSHVSERRSGAVASLVPETGPPSSKPKFW